MSNRTMIQRLALLALLALPAAAQEAEITLDPGVCDVVAAVASATRAPVTIEGPRLRGPRDVVEDLEALARAVVAPVASTVAVVRLWEGRSAALVAPTDDGRAKLAAFRGALEAWLPPALEEEEPALVEEANGVAVVVGPTPLLVELGLLEEEPVVLDEVGRLRVELGRTGAEDLASLFHLVLRTSHRNLHRHPEVDGPALVASGLPEELTDFSKAAHGLESLPEAVGSRRLVRLGWGQLLVLIRHASAELAQRGARRRAARPRRAAWAHDRPFGAAGTFGRAR